MPTILRSGAFTGQRQDQDGPLVDLCARRRPGGEDTAPAVWFAYSENRKGEHPRGHLKNFHGALQADAYADFTISMATAISTRLQCWAHARRKFHEIHVLHASPTTAQALERHRRLYAIEEQIRGKPAELRREVRQTRARPCSTSSRSGWKRNCVRSRRKRDRGCDPLCAVTMARSDRYVMTGTLR